MSILTKDQQSLLLYLECRVVDHGGYVNSQQMNEADFAIAKAWDGSGFILFRRLRMAASKWNQSHVIRLSDEAFTEAHEARMARSEKNVTSSFEQIRDATTKE